MQNQNFLTRLKKLFTGKNAPESVTKVSTSNQQVEQSNANARDTQLENIQVPHYLSDCQRGSVQCASTSGLHRMAYLAWGDPSNPRVLLCLHGLTRRGSDFAELARAMSDQYYVVCPTWWVEEILITLQTQCYMVFHNMSVIW